MSPPWSLVLICAYNQQVALGCWRLCTHRGSGPAVEFVRKPRSVRAHTMGGARRDPPEHRWACSRRRLRSEFRERELVAFSFVLVDIRRCTVRAVTHASREQRITANCLERRCCCGEACSSCGSRTRRICPGGWSGRRAHRNRARRCPAEARAADRSSCSSW